MPKPGEYWTLAQALVWIVCTLDDLASDQERDADLGKLYTLPDNPEKTPTFAYCEALRWKAVQQDIGDEMPSRFVEDGEPLMMREVGATLKSAWENAREDLLDEVRRGQVATCGLAPYAGARFEKIPTIQCAALEFREDFDEVFACRRDDGRPLWRSIRFRAEEIVARWNVPSIKIEKRGDDKALVSSGEAKRALNDIANKEKKKPQLKLELRARFPQQRISDAMFESLYKKLPSNLKRMRGDSDRKLAHRDNTARG